MTDAVVVGWFFIVAGAAVGIAACALLMIERSSRSWQSTKGQVVESRVEGDMTDVGARSYRLHVTYSYDVDGKTYTGHRIAFGESLFAFMKSKEWAKQMRAKFESLDEVFVFYDPRHPERSTLVRDLDTKRVAQVLIAAIVLIAAGAGAVTGMIKVR